MADAFMCMCLGRRSRGRPGQCGDTATQEDQICDSCRAQCKAQDDWYGTVDRPTNYLAQWANR